MLTAAATVLEISIIWLIKEALQRGGIRSGAGSIDVDMSVITTFILIAIGAILARWVVERSAIQINVFAYQILSDIRVAAFEHVQRQGLAFFHRFKTGVVISRLTNDVDALEHFVLDGVWMVLRNSLSIIGIEIVLFFMDVKLALAVNVVLPPMLLATYWFRTRSIAAYRIVRERLALVTSHLAESLGGVDVVQSFAAESRMQSEFERHVARHTSANMRTVWLNAVYFPLVELLGVLATIVVLWYGGLLADAGAIDIAILFAFIAYLSNFFDPIQQLSQFYNSYLAAMAALDKIANLLDTKPDLADNPNARRLSKVEGRIEVDSVTFRYAEDLPDVLVDVSLAVEPGERVALVGQTGAGKSTLVKLLSRFYDPTQGSVRLDGNDVRELEAAWMRRQLGLVPQEVFLFAGTIRDNVRFAKPDATDAEVDAAITAVGADDILLRLPDGYNTQVGERGRQLSAGEALLVAFARAMLAQPPVLVLDEATSSVDVTTEQQLMRSMARLIEGRTSIIVAHRLSTVRSADRIVVVQDGRIVEQGTHDGLIAAQGSYASLHREWLESGESTEPSSISRGFDGQVVAGSRDDA
jgi:ATP-binding cassette subfamily B protein